MLYLETNEFIGRRKSDRKFTAEFTSKGLDIKNGKASSIFY